MGDVEIQPKAVLAVDQSAKTVEVDVWLPSFNLGIECKVYENPLAPITHTRLGSMAGELSKQIENYREAGIDKVLVVTNLPKSASAKLEKSVKSRLASLKIELGALGLIPGEVESLIQTLDALSSQVSKAVMAAYEKSLEQQPKLEPEKTTRSHRKSN